MRHYREIKDKDPGKLLTPGGNFDDIGRSLLFGGYKWHGSKYTLQTKYQNLFQDSSYPPATDKTKYKQVKINPRFCYKRKNSYFTCHTT